MIKTIKHKGLKKLFYRGITSGVQQNHVERLRDILSLLDAAATVQDVNFIGSNLHALEGNLEGFWSVKVNHNWRIIFELVDGDAYLVDYIDYH